MTNIRKVHPGIIIKEILETTEMTAREFSIRTGISERTLSSIINGNGSITFDIAYKLSRYFDQSINFWTNLQNQYDLYLKEMEEKNEIETEWKLVKSIKKYLLDGKYINDDDDKITIILKTRKLAGVNSLLLLERRDSFVCLKEHHSNNEANLFYQNFWIALALNEARNKNSDKYDKDKLKQFIPEIRSMTTKMPNEFLDRLNEILESCGISFIILPYLAKSNIYGATKWFAKDNVMLAISNRRERADLFWFTLFHELSHVLMEHRREMLINIDGNFDYEANKLAENMLIPNDKWEQFMKKGVFSIQTIEIFAKEVNVLPLIVVGRLHKEIPDIIPYGVFDKEFYVSYDVS